MRKFNKINFYIKKKFEYKKSLKDIKKIFNYLSNELDFSSVEVSIWFVNNKKIKDLNKIHRNKNEITDVLSFPHNEVEEGRLYIGDVFINKDIIYNQSKLINSDPLTEIKFLSMHGMLHLIGYNHSTKKNEEKMTHKQREIFRNLKIRKDKE